ncbi:NADH dehydrogenase [ubiquinone] 1 alpha subcomplex assembly factor 3 isoform X2 [Ostrinia furnacalis]|uniref:NADH dehydrogenase [ubiquinone] 1 alpha subcomplex assembly factor 3 isoform X1 n=1 Tax=Ostrinia furnacalis TaxID=93504 RepID=UPI00103A685F|nr:NADH dehydrogenase [ubiquinone] 1 alpha subcomplex assembly factor 3 isoform X1 [Ostrinia furnacalis]XP_028169243.1 NADH dehydrogenase [ubiquinone] 1 alpha subcomplex assembly factor 3 isoform X1 [Ostrinia furnacalis]XP_028169244.1 NADH dehydrogenase [ubiquinone] 1 alpha subcomplex assembly factor 3 isoform X2 [Ostrinia furnacalis]XP_028169245.1 NADH dehydrogenase [ubiquinone] 1 alpha subcomplex assembly factor 3 isoform X2 [Ostrinia furnacalis]
MLSLIVRQAGAIAKKSTPLLSSVRHKAAYEGDGKTTVRVINQEQDLGLMIDSYATYGFRLNNGITVLGPMAIFPRTVLSWQVGSSEEITEESLRLFKLLEPKIDLVIMGIEANDRSIMGPVFRAAKANKLNVEILPTEHACSTFNFLNAEGRCVAAALIPPTSVQMNEDDQLRTSMHYANVYEKEL